MEKITLSTHFTYRKIIRQCLPPIIMMIFTSLYVAVDGIFVSNFVGEDAFAGLNLVAPVIMIVGGLGFMFGSGGGALASKLLGEKKADKANKVFTMMIEAALIIVTIIGIAIFFFIDKIVVALASISPSSTQEMVENAILYAKILLPGQAIYAVASLFQNFFVVNERPDQGLYQAIVAGVVNIIFDAIFICGFNMGIAGASIGTLLGYLAGALYAILFFVLGKNNILKIKLCKINPKILLKSMGNGASDFIFNIASSIVGFLFNIQLLNYIGQDGVTAYGVIMYLSFIFVSVFIGFAIGMGPVIGYNYGAKNHDELHNVMKKLFVIFTVVSITITALCEILATPLSMIFTNDPKLIELSTTAMRYYSICYLFSGFCIIITAMFTSLNNGLVSGLLSLVRTLIIEILLLFLLPFLWGVVGLWWTVPICEFIATVNCVICYFAFKKRYQY